MAAYYESKKLTINKDFLTYVTSLGAYGMSTYKRKFSVLFSSGFTSIIKEYNNELVERFFRSSDEYAFMVRFEIAHGYYPIAKCLKNDLINYEKNFDKLLFHVRLLIIFF